MSNCRTCKNPGCAARGTNWTPRDGVKCFGYEPVTGDTRGDLVRQMTDEELAEWLVEHDEKCFHFGHLSKEGYVAWLKEEVQE